MGQGHTSMIECIGHWSIEMFQCDVDLSVRHRIVSVVKERRTVTGLREDVRNERH